MVSLIQTTIATMLGPLVGGLQLSRQTIERQADALRELERENGRQSAEFAALKSPRWDFHGRATTPWLLSALAIVAVVVLLAWR
jgi:hypothetical protein